MANESSAEDAAEREPRDVTGRALRSSGRGPFRAGFVLGVIITVAIALLVIQNGDSTELNWLTFEFSAPLWILLLIMLGAGAVVWETGQILWRRGRRRRAEQRMALRETRER